VLDIEWGDAKILNVSEGMTDRLRGSGTLNDLLGYLDSVETTLASDFVLPDLSQAAELHEEVNSRIAELEATLTQAREKEATVKQQLQNVLKTTADEKAELKAKLLKKLNAQKGKYDEALCRHQALLDGLIREKEELSRQCEALAKRASVAREEANRREKEVQDQAATQIAQQRELAIAQERARQKKILEQKTREIKEATVKGLEPELQNLILKQKRDLDAIKAEHEESLRVAREAAERRCEEERQRLLDQLERDRKAEFDSLEQRLQKQLERERDLHKAELGRLALKLKSAESEKTAAIQATKDENEALLNETRERWKAELAAERLRAVQEMEKIDQRVNQARQSMALKKEALAAEAEERMRQEMEEAAKQKNERKLQLVVKKLEEETNAIRRKLQEESNARIQAATAEAKATLEGLQAQREMLETELAQVKKSTAEENRLLSKLEVENQRLNQEIETQRTVKEQLQAEVAKKEREIKDTKEANAKRIQEAKEAADAERKSLRAQLEEARHEFEKQKAVWAHERHQLEEKNQAELNAVSKKVKNLLESKEQTIQGLKDQLGAAQSRMREIEDLFHQNKRMVLTARR
jgi:5-azacytidine-induced protein 1